MLEGVLDGSMASLHAAPNHQVRLDAGVETRRKLSFLVEIKGNLRG